MIRVRLEGGLGNQLFQYAAGRALAVRHGCGLELDASWYQDIQTGVTARGFELGHFKCVADITVPRKKYLFSKFPLILRINQWMPGFSIYREVGMSFNEQFWLLPDQTYLIGYWQSYRYADEILSLLKSELEPTRPLSLDNQLIAQKISSTSSVALHIRRGDYVSLVAASKHHGALGISYYQAALRRIRDQISSPTIFVFSDEPEWCRSNLLLDDADATFVGNNSGPSAWQDLILMSHCEHHIIANSSFSWWGAFLADLRRPSAQRIVIAPRRWFNTNAYQDVSDRLPYHWVKL
jgi:hypothetical protein